MRLPKKVVSQGLTEGNTCVSSKTIDPIIINIINKLLYARIFEKTPPVGINFTNLFERSLL
jgi:hypothetical protein